MDAPKSILVPVDFGGPSLRACDRAVALARDLHAAVTLLHVVEPPPYPLAESATVQLREGAERAMALHAAKLRPHVQELRTHVVVGTPWREVLAAIDAEHADLVVAGTHGRRGIAHVALGSVAERIVRTSPVPVLTIPGHAFERREDAGHRLAAELRSHELSSPAVVALSRAALPVAASIASACGGTLDVWATSPVVVAGQRVGTMGEDGLAYYDDVHCEPSFDRLTAEARATDDVREEASGMRGARTVGDVGDRLVVLVSDALVCASPVMSAVRALRPLGASGFLLAAPMATPAGHAAASDLVDEVVSLETAILADAVADVYRSDVAPSFREARALLGASPGSPRQARRAS